MTEEDSFNRAISLVEAGELEQALLYFDNAITEDPDNEDYWASKGTTLASLGRYEEAIECFDRALAIDHDFTAVMGEKGASLLQMGRNEEALDYLNRALAFHGNYPELPPAFVQSLWGLKGLAHEELGDEEGEGACFDRVIEIDSAEQSAWVLTGPNLTQVRWHAAVEPCIDAVLARNPFDKRNWAFMGITQYLEGRYGEAITSFDKALEIDPEYKVAREYKEAAEEKWVETKDSVKN